MQFPEQESHIEHLNMYKHLIIMNIFYNKLTELDQNYGMSRCRNVIV